MIRSMMVISGAAGTGKTMAIKDIDDDYDDEIIICTYTNKAANVLRERGLHTATTIHSALYKPVKTGTRNVFRMLKKDGYPLLDENGVPIMSLQEEDVYEFIFSPEGEDPLIVIDEASMVPSKIWHDILSNFTGDLIVVGDKKQLPPVEGEDRIEKYEDFFANLPSTIDLGDNSSNRRIEGDNLLSEIVERVMNTGNFPKNNSENYSHAFLNKITPEVLKSFTEADCVIVFRNSERDFVNNLIRGVLYGEKSIEVFKGYQIPVPKVGEILVADNKSFGFSKGERFKIISRETTDLEQNIIIYRILRERYFDTHDLEMVEPISLCVQDWVASHDARPKKKEKIGNKVIKQYIEVLRWRFTYSLTCHMAQGSGFDNVVVIDSYPDYPNTHEMRKRWTYTAATRVKKNLTVYETRYKKAISEENL